MPNCKKKRANGCKHGQSIMIAAFTAFRNFLHPAGYFIFRRANNVIYSKNVDKFFKILNMKCFGAGTGFYCRMANSDFAEASQVY